MKINRLEREKRELLEIIGELTTEVKRKKKQEAMAKTKLTKKELADKLGVSVSSLCYKPETKHKNIVENICPIRSNIVWVTDFTYIKYQNKFFDLATIMDVFTREIVGVNIARYHNQELVVGTLEDTLSRNSRPEILHSDQGSE